MTVAVRGVCGFLGSSPTYIDYAESLPARHGEMLLGHTTS